jgi:hypothetical protein
MSLLKRLFGGSEPKTVEPVIAAQAEHKGFIIRATPFKEGGQFQTCGVVSKEIGGEVKEHKFIRADRFATLEDAVSVSLSKGRQLVDEQGERMFS